MVLRDIDFGHVLNFSGAQGFFGEGYPFHRFWKWVGLTFEEMTFTTKTTTLNERLNPVKKEGNMPMKSDGITPAEMFPKCIVVKFGKGVVLNAVGLSGPGAHALFNIGWWQMRTQPFVISFMSVAATLEQRVAEFRLFSALFFRHLPRFQTRVALELNVSCPNVGLHFDELMGEVRMLLDIASELDCPVIIKINALLHPTAAVAISQHPACDAICVSNTIPWGQLPDKINWKGLFGSDISPLAHLGGGGLSGKPLLPIVEDWVKKARDNGLIKPIIAGGGVLGPEDALRLLRADADAIALGTIAILRPWRMRKTIKAINDYFGRLPGKNYERVNNTVTV